MRCLERDMAGVCSVFDKLQVIWAADDGYPESNPGICSL